MLLRFLVVLLLIGGIAILDLVVLPELARWYRRSRNFVDQQVRAANEAAEEETEV